MTVGISVIIYELILRDGVTPKGPFNDGGGILSNSSIVSFGRYGPQHRLNRLEHTNWRPLCQVAPSAAKRPSKLPTESSLLGKSLKMTEGVVERKESQRIFGKIRTVFRPTLRPVKILDCNEAQSITPAISSTTESIVLKSGAPQHPQPPSPATPSKTKSLVSQIPDASPKSTTREKPKLPVIELASRPGLHSDRTEEANESVMSSMPPMECSDSQAPDTFSSASANLTAPSLTQLDPFGDRERTEKRYEDATAQLKKSLNISRRHWQTFEIPNFGNISENDPIPQLREQIQKTLVARMNSVKDRDFWSKGKNIIERVFTATSPFAKKFLEIAKEGQSVCCFCS